MLGGTIFIKLLVSYIFHEEFQFIFTEIYLN